MPCYNRDGNQIPGTPQTCASLGGVWAMGEEMVVPPEPTTPVNTPSTIGNGEWDWADFSSFANDPEQAAKDYWAGNSASDIAVDASMLIPGSLALRGAWAGGKSALQSDKMKKLIGNLFKSDKKILSKGKGKTPKGEPIPMYKGGKPVLDKRGNPVYQTEKVISPAKIGAGASVGLGVGGMVGKNQEQEEIRKLKAIEDAKKQLKSDSGGKSSSLWDDFTGGLGSVKDWAYAQQGNAPWDNRLYRLGELMSYSMNPSNQRPANPSDRWGEAADVASTNQANIIKAGFKGNKPGKLTLPQFKKNFAENIEQLRGEGTLFDFFDDYSDTEIEGVVYKIWQVHQRNPDASFEDIVSTLKKQNT
ncbi:MAG: hypothetical protein NZ811_02030, partial [Gammaproteobacteria bacterium]|nr:hypothetical protein [Gammaproteobacteria bacterium]